MQTIEELETSNSFLTCATLNHVVHDGTCFMRCLLPALNIEMEQLVTMFANLGDDPYASEEVRTWCVKFKDNYPLYLADAKKTRMLASESYGTTEVLLQFARVMQISILLLGSHPERRHGVKLRDLLEPVDPVEGSLVVVINVSGQKFDYFSPKPEKEKLYWEFVDSAIAVSWSYI